MSATDTNISFEQYIEKFGRITEWFVDSELNFNLIHHGIFVQCVKNGPTRGFLESVSTALWFALQGDQTINGCGYNPVVYYIQVCQMALKYFGVKREETNCQKKTTSYVFDYEQMGLGQLTSKLLLDISSHFHVKIRFWNQPITYDNMELTNDDIYKSTTRFNMWGHDWLRKYKAEIHIVYWPTGHFYCWLPMVLTKPVCSKVVMEKGYTYFVVNGDKWKSFWNDFTQGTHPEIKYDLVK